MKSASDGLQCYCRACKNESIRAWRKENPERAREITKRYQAANPERYLELSREGNKRFRDNNIERYLELARERDRRYRAANPERLREANKRYRTENPDQVRETSERYRAGNPEKRRAHYAVNSAIRAGKLVPARTCEKCDTASKLEAHHEDYSRPLDVMWLCRICHNARHRKLNNLSHPIHAYEALP